MSLSFPQKAPALQSRYDDDEVKKIKSNKYERIRILFHSKV